MRRRRFIFCEGSRDLPTTNVRMLSMAGLDALRSSFRDVYPRLFRFVFSRTDLPPSDVDDIVQEALVHGWQRREEFLEQSSFETWLFSIAQHKIADFWRGRKRSQSHLAPEVLDALQKIDAAALPEELLKTAEMRRRVAEALDRLDADYARVLTLRYLHDLPVRAIAARTGDTESAVESRLTRAREAFRRYLGDKP